MDETLYFAYGSNLDQEQMRKRCPGARVVAPSVLRGYRIAFGNHSIKRGGAVATIVPDPAAQVDGLLYRISQRELAVLDRVEGHKYARHTVEALDREGRVQRAQTYLMTIDRALPAEPRYYAQIERAYRALGFDLGPLQAARLGDL